MTQPQSWPMHSANWHGKHADKNPRQLLAHDDAANGRPAPAAEPSNNRPRMVLEALASGWAQSAARIAAHRPSK